MGVIKDIAGLFGAEAQKDRYRSGINAVKRGNQEATNYTDKYYGELENEFQPGYNQYFDDLEAYRNAQEYADLGDFDTSGYNVDTYLDPSIDYEMQQMGRAVDQSAAARGGMFSGGGAQAKELQDRGNAIARTGYGKAYDRMENDKKNAYGRFIDKFDANRSKEQEQYNRLGNLLNLSGNERQKLLDTRGARTQNINNNTLYQAGQEQAKHNMIGDYWRGQSNNVGNAGDSAVKLGMDIYTGGTAGAVKGGNL